MLECHGTVARRTRLVTLLICFSAILGAGASRVGAQSAPGRAELWTIATLAAATMAIAPLDASVAGEVRTLAGRRPPTVARAALVFRELGGSGVYLLSTGTYAVGRLTGRPNVADAGLHITEAIVASGAVTAVAKVLVGRARPYSVPDTDADEFRFGRGWGANTSFPSGHTTVAFAAAAGAHAELARSAFGRLHPNRVRLLAPVLYGSAALVGVSRLYHDQHWASDVVAGAAIGIVTSRVLVRRQHAGAPGAIERWLLPNAIDASKGGAAIGWSASFR